MDPDSDEDWERILQISRNEVREMLAKENSVVFDDINLKYADREILRNIAKEQNAEPVLIYLDTPREIQKERQGKNFETKERHDVPEHIIDWGLKELEIPQENENPFIFKSETSALEWLVLLP